MWERKRNPWEREEFVRRKKLVRVTRKKKSNNNREQEVRRRWIKVLVLSIFEGSGRKEEREKEKTWRSRIAFPEGVLLNAIFIHSSFLFLLLSFSLSFTFCLSFLCEVSTFFFITSLFNLIFPKDEKEGKDEDFFFSEKNMRTERRKRN